MNPDIIEKCLALSQTLVNSNRHFIFNLSIGKDIFNFESKELTKCSCAQKKKSPSQQRREQRRREERKLDKSREVSGKETGQSPPSVFSCDECDMSFESDLKV